MTGKNLVYWIERKGRWMSVFITTSDLPKTEYGDIVGKIYNIRRRDSHKKLRLCWENVTGRAVNNFKEYGISPKDLEERYKGPFPVDWKY